jgi:hypothetical protein
MKPNEGRRSEAEVNKTNEILNDVRAQLAPSDDILKTARDRRTAVLAAAYAFDGVRDKYVSGSIAHGTANNDLDADCGVVLDRRKFPELGPDGDGVGPNKIVKRVRDFVADWLEDEDEKYDVRLTKRRAIKVSVDDGPTVDLVVALERHGAPGVWIPNRPEDDWDAAHPAKHTELFTSGTKKLRRVRARAIRLAKGWNHQYDKPGLSSFNIEALAWECVEESMTVGDALQELFTYGAKELAAGETDDPAGVSGAIRLLVDRTEVVARLEHAADLMTRAMDAGDDDQAARSALSQLFWDYVDAPKSGASSKAALADALRRGETMSVGAKGLAIGSTAEAQQLKRTRPYGDAAPQR